MRRLSQVFLTDRSFIERMVSEVSPLPGDIFLEVGPGRGALTRPILERGASVLAIELDLLLLDSLKEGLGPEFGERFIVVHGDYLSMPVEPLLPAKPARFISNLPYHISTPALEKVAEEAGLYRDAHLTLQKELAERICADPGTKQYGYISVLVRLRYEPRILFYLWPRAFSPTPKVMSAFLRLTSLGPPDRLALRACELARLAFGSRRRALRNSLKPALGAKTLSVLENAGVSPEKRADQLSPEEYLEIARSEAGL